MKYITNMKYKTVTGNKLMILYYVHKIKFYMKNYINIKLLYLKYLAN